MPSEQKTRILVTGASGFLGRSALRALARRSEVETIAACRTPSKLDPSFRGEIRSGDLLDPAYRASLAQGVDVIFHGGGFASLWDHADLETSQFLEPSRDLVEQAIRAGVRRFVQSSTMVIARPPRDGTPLDDFAEPCPTGFWPHLDRLIELDRFMRANATRGTEMVCLRFGHFVGAGNSLGLIPALVPRLRTYLVPWLSGGRSRLPLVADDDLGESVALAAIAGDLDAYESFNVCGPEFPTVREVIELVARETGAAVPLFGVPHSAGYAFGWLMETLAPVLPWHSPFLTRSIVHLAEDWPCSTIRATERLGYVPRKDWRQAVREALAELSTRGFPWPRLAPYA